MEEGEGEQSENDMASGTPLGSLWSEGEDWMKASGFLGLSFLWNPAETYPEGIVRRRESGNCHVIKLWFYFHIELCIVSHIINTVMFCSYFCFSSLVL